MAKNSGYRSQKLAPASFKQGSGIRKKVGKKQGGYISFSLQPHAFQVPSSSVPALWE